MPTVVEMTTNELREMIEAVIEKKLVELLGNPDERFSLMKPSWNRLLGQIEAVAYEYAHHYQSQTS